MRPTTEAFVLLPTQRWEATPLVANLKCTLPPQYVSQVMFLPMFFIFCFLVDVKYTFGADPEMFFSLSLTLRDRMFLQFL